MKKVNYAKSNGSQRVIYSVLHYYDTIPEAANFIKRNGLFSSQLEIQDQDWVVPVMVVTGRASVEEEFCAESGSRDWAGPTLAFITNPL